MQPVCFLKAGQLSGVRLFSAFNRSHKHDSLSRLVRGAARYDKFQIGAGSRELGKFLVKTTRPIVNGRRPNVCSLYLHLYFSSSFFNGWSGQFTVLDVS